MPKSAVRVPSQRRHGRYRPGGLANAIEGRIAEICRDLAIQTKRMQQLHEQADELRVVISQWAPKTDSSSEPGVRGTRR